MRLKKSQKEQVLQWIAEGLESDEINARAAEFEDPFKVSRQQVDFYRKSRSIDLAALRKASEQDALTEGLAVVGERVRRLKMLAELIEQDIFGGFLWTENSKGIGSGEVAEIYDFEEFNASEVSAYRGVLDDIAREVGDRIQKQDVTSKGEQIQFVNVGVDLEKL